LLHPITSLRPWAKLPQGERDQIALTAYGLHHWHNTWCSEPITRKQRQFPVALLDQSRPLIKGQLDLNSYQPSEQPLVSCLMVTRARPELALRAIHCFQLQSYPARELVIVDDDPGDTLARAVAALADPRIVHMRLANQGLRLGELRNIALDRASGAYVTQWDDDDLSDPERLEIQLAAIQLLKADACFLERHQLWWPQQRRMAFSTRRAWEGSFVCAKALVPRYPALAKGEDTPVTTRILQGSRVALLDVPQLYTYVFHGQNTFDATHWDQHWQAATATFEHAAYAGMLAHLATRHRLNPNGQMLHPHHSPLPRREEVIRPSHRSRAAGESILIATPIKNAARHLPRFLANLRRLSYPHQQITLALLESDSDDNTHGILSQLLPDLRTQFARVELLQHNFSYHSEQPRWAVGEQSRRRSVLAQSRNLLLKQALQDETWLLWLDVDVADYPADVIDRLLAVGKDIVVPNCVVAPNGRTFDYNSFKLAPGAEQIDWTPHIIDGLLQPPIGLGRHYLNDLRSHDLVEIDAVGGTMLLVRAELHRQGLIFPEQSYKHYIETEGLAMLAKDMGFRCWGLPNLEIVHPSV
ncbi:MAG: glycosyltransferase, partial [Roseiflexaceae bacterium]|nr:glycosyltransferase [Roseiflexaceae bacterium]